MNAWVEFVASVLRAFWIQGSLLLVLAFLVLRLLERRTARLRAGVIATTWIALLLLPFASRVLPSWRILPRIGNELSRSEQTVIALPAARSARGMEGNDPTSMVARSDETVPGLDPSAAVDTSLASTHEEAWSRPLVETSSWTWIVATYVLGLAWFALRHVRGAGCLRRVVQRAVPAPENVQRHARGWFARAGSKRRASVFLLPDADRGAFTTGCFRARVYLPANFEAIEPGRRDAMLAHECAHVLYRDVTFLALERVVSRLAWIQPLVFPLVRRSAMERERAADDWVLSHTNTSATAYATWLVEHADRHALGLAFARRAARMLERRVRAVLDPKTLRVERPRWRVCANLGAMALVLPLASLTVRAPDVHRQDPEPVLTDVTNETLRSRAEFALAMERVSVGTPLDDVRALLGEPDDVITQRDGRGISTVGTKFIWCYGTNGHLTTPTLGQVYVDTRDRVQYVFGNGEPRTPATFPEATLREHLRAIDGLSGYDAGLAFHPGRLIRATNRFLPLGKDRALQVIAEYLRISSAFHSTGRSGVFLLLRTLFDPPEGQTWPRMLVGAPMMTLGGAERDWPRFPLDIVGDVPILVTQGYMLAGRAESPEEHMRWYVKHGVLRGTPLRPMDRPVEGLRAWLAKPRATQGPVGTSHWNFVGNQLARLLDTVYQPEAGRYGTLLPYDSAASESAWKVMEALTIHWDETRQAYVFEDGSTLPARVAKHYSRTVWTPIDGEPVEASVVRTSQDDVELTVRYPKRLEGSFGIVLQREVDREFQDLAVVGKAIALPPGGVRAEFSGDTSSVITSRTLGLPAGTRTRLVLRRADGETVLDPFVP